MGFQTHVMVPGSLCPSFVQPFMDAYRSEICGTSVSFETGFLFFFFGGGGGGWEESRVVYSVGVGVLAEKKRVSRFQMSRGWHLCKTDSVRDRLETDFLESSSGGVFVRVSFPSFTVQALRIQQGSTSPQR